MNPIRTTLTGIVLLLLLGIVAAWTVFLKTRPEPPSPHVVASELANGYRIETQKLSRGTYAWTLRLSRDNQHQTVCRALVKNGQVVALMPTPVACGTYSGSVPPGFRVVHVPRSSPNLNLRLERSGRVSLRELPGESDVVSKMFQCMLALDPEMVVVIETALPVPCRALERWVQAACQFRGNMAVVRMGDNPKPVSGSKLPPTPNSAPEVTPPPHG